MKKVVTSEKEMMKEAAQFARTLRGGEVVLLEGDLGTGKTTFVRGLAKALGVRRGVRSPTFTLLHTYKGALKTIVHIDAYRLGNASELRDLGIDEDAGKKDHIVVIEWGGKVKDLFKKFRPTIIHFEHGASETERIIC